MAAKKKRTNPFYILLVLVGISFTITACAYGVMTVRGIRPELVADGEESGAGLMHYLDKEGFSLLMWQLGILAVLTVAAMLADQYWIRQDESVDANAAPPSGAYQGDAPSINRDSNA